MKNGLFLSGIRRFANVEPARQEPMRKGKMEVYVLGNFRLHVYYTFDALGDTSYIIEGANGLVTMEHPLFRDNAAEFDSYVEGLRKPVVKIITDYHVGSTGSHTVVMPEGMAAFAKGPVYSGMMQNFAGLFGDAITLLPVGATEEIPFETTEVWAGIPFTFRRGASTDFPGASIIIGGKAYYTHWTPSKAHMSHLQISSPEAVDAEIREARRELESGCELFIGGHGGAVRADSVEFKITYLETIKRLLAECAGKEGFAEALRGCYPSLPGEEEVPGLAAVLYAGRK